MKIIVDYVILSGENTLELGDSVRDFIGKCWQPQGGLTVTTIHDVNGSICNGTSTTTKCKYSQAMVKYHK